MLILIVAAAAAAAAGGSPLQKRSDHRKQRARWIFVKMKREANFSLSSLTKVTPAVRQERGECKQLNSLRGGGEGSPTETGGRISPQISPGAFLPSFSPGRRDFDFLTRPGD